MLYTLARKMLRGYSMLIYLAVLAVAVYSIIRYFGYLEPPLCEARPIYNAEVPAEVRQRVDFLFDSGLLYCGETKAGLAAVSPTIYWGSDGSRSTVFFQALPGENLGGVGISEYVFGTDILPPPIGDSRQDGFTIDATGRPAWLNQAGAPDATWYFREDGAPAPWDVSVRLDVVGPAIEQASATGRDFEQDLERIWDAIQGNDDGGGRRVTRPVTLRIMPERWEGRVTRGELNPALADEKGAFVPLRVATTALAQPTLLQTVSGASASTVWVAGVISGTRPVLVIAPAAGGGGAAIEPIAQGNWVTNIGPQRLASFAFDPQPLDTAFEARYWNDERERESAPPDYSWPIVFASQPPATPAPGTTSPPATTPPGTTLSVASPTP
jgi:hypothetical protein